MNIGCFGTFNIDNYGDLLLGEINQRLYARHFDGAAISIFSPDFEKKWIAPQHGAISAFEMTARDLDAVIVGGGDILRLAPTDEHLASSLAPFSASQWNWMLPAAMAKVKGLPLLINAAGVPSQFTAVEAEVVRSLHGENTLAAVRDPISARYLEDALDREVEVVPDPAFCLPDVYADSVLSSDREALLAEMSIDPREPYAAIQCSPGFLGNSGELFLEAVAAQARSSGLKMVMVPICYLWGDLSASNEAASRCSLVASAGRRLTVRETAALISGARWFAGSSLHGCLTAMAYGNPALMIGLRSLTKFEGAMEMYPEGLRRSQSWKDFPSNLAAMDAADSGRVARMAAKCRSKVLDFQARGASFISEHRRQGEGGDFRYNPKTGDLNISDLALRDSLYRLNTHYLQDQVRRLSEHQDWIKEVVSDAQDDIEESRKGGVSLDSLSESLRRRLSSVSGRANKGWFGDYEDQGQVVQDETPAQEREPLVSIIVPAHECWELTKACVESIRKNTRQNYELILVDDASSSATAAKIMKLSDANTRVIRNEQRLSYSANNNQAAAVARGELLCLLNNDTYVEPGWLRTMVAVMDANPTVGLVGNKHLFPNNGKLHHCGMAFDGDGHPWHLHPNTNPDAPSVNYEREVPCVTFACVMIRRELYEQLNGLDEEYRNGYEDCDFCLRARGEGWGIRYTPASMIYHYGQASPDRKDHDSENWKLFESRWNGNVEKSFEIISKADRDYNMKTAESVVALGGSLGGIHFAVDFSRGGAFTWGLAELIAALVERGEDVSVAPASKLPGLDPDKRRMLRKLMKKAPRKTFHLKWSHFWPDHIKVPLAGDINAEFFCTNYLYSRENRRLDLWMRHVQVSDNRWIPISAFNRQALQEIDIPSGRMAKVPLGYAPEVDRVLPDGKTRKLDDSAGLKLLMITNSEDLQRYGTDVAVRAFGKAFAKTDNITLHIKDYGAHTGSKVLKEWIASQASFPKIVWHNQFLPKMELMELYASMDALIAPYRGEGFGMKIIDAMALGVPVVMPDFGGPCEYSVEGGYIPVQYKTVPVRDCCDTRENYLGHGAYWCEVEEDALVDVLKSLPKRRSELHSIGEVARRHVRSNYKWSQAASELMRCLKFWEAQRLASVAERRAPSSLPASVLIPTCNREEILGSVLEAFKKQDLKSDRYEIVIVNDHGDHSQVKRVVDEHGAGLNIRLFDNDGARGAAGARNFGLRCCRGEIVVIIGDDIVPESNFVSAHLALHDRYADVKTACVGQTLWHPDLMLNPLMMHLSGEGGQQFNYRDAKHGRPVSFDRFYTSNVSIKRAFIVEEESLFRTIFRMYGYEDIELAYRLHLKGMTLLYNENAVGYHHHPMTSTDFLKRQYRVGRMLTLLSLVQPAYVPDEHTAFLRSLEFANADETVDAFMADRAGEEKNDAFLTGAMLSAMQEIMDLLPALNATGRIGVFAKDAFKHSEWLTGSCGPIADAMGTIALREGMAAEWAENGADRKTSEAWVRMVALRSVLKEGEDSSFAHVLQSPRTVAEALFRSGRMPSFLRFVRSIPGSGWIIDRLERSMVAEIIKRKLQP